MSAILANALRKITAARTALVLDSPFFGSLVLRLKMMSDPTCSTAWTNGTHIGYNPAYVMSLSHDALVGLLVHEVMHCACGHPWRRDAREHKRFNVAADYAINHVIASAGFSLPDGALRDPQFDGKSAEWIYDRLPESNSGSDGDDDGSGDGTADGTPSSDGTPGNGACDVRDADSVTDDNQTTESDWQQAVQQAANAAQQRGELPGALKRFAKEAAKPKADWRSVLHRFVQQRATDDYTWRVPSARYVNRGLYLPSLRSERCGPIAIAVDTSGSIDDVLLKQFAAEIRSIVDDVRPSQVSIIWCDARVHRVDTFGPDDAITFDPIGGGGTRFEPVFETIAEMDESPVCCIYLTDLYGSFPDAREVTVPTLWAVTGSNRAVPPFGDRVDVE